MIDVNANILLIYTGGTIGMVENVKTGTLEAFDFSHLYSHIPELQRLKFQVDTHLFESVLDSSDVGPEHWVQLVGIIEENYEKYDGFVVLHGTDAMTYTASALSFMIENLTKPIVFTGAQLPIGKLRTDAKENLITAMEIAADKDVFGKPIVPEVCIFFQNYLFRANRSTKRNADNFNAFKSYNYPYLAKSGIKIKYDRQAILTVDFSKKTTFHYWMDTNIAVLKLFPGIGTPNIDAILNLEGVRGVIIETFGSGNAPRNPKLLEAIKSAVQRGIIVVNITQCEIGSVVMERYETGKELLNAGVISGFDSTIEAAITKLMYLIGHKYSPQEIERRMKIPIVGEITRLDESY